MSKDYDERSNFKDENPLAWLAPNYLNNSGLQKVRAPFGEVAEKESPNYNPLRVAYLNASCRIRVSSEIFDSQEANL